MIGFTGRKGTDESDRIPEASESGEPEEGYVFRGHFLDLRTLAFALTDRAYTLEAACDAFGVEHGKQRVQRHGIVTPKYIDYTRKKLFWIDGWIAVRQTMYYDSKAFTPEAINRLASLEALLRPQGTVQQVRSIVLAESASYVGVPLVGNADESVESGWSRLQDLAYDLGKSVAADSSTFAELLPELVSARGDQIWSFARGLAQGANDPVAVWKLLSRQLKIAPKGATRPEVFGGFINGLHQTNHSLAGSLLDQAIDNDLLGEWYPALETAAGTIDALGFRRLIRSLEIGRAPIHTYRSLMSGGATHGLCGQEFNKLLLKISDREGGTDIAIDILSMRLSFSRDRSSPEELIEVGCELLRRLRRTGNMGPGLTHRLQMVGKYCLVADKGAASVREVCGNLRDAISRSETSPYAHREFLQLLFSAQPLAVLQSLCSHRGHAAAALSRFGAEHSLSLS